MVDSIPFQTLKYRRYKKTAIVLFNLGGPDSPDAVEPFLFNLFYDPAIIKLPNPWRWLVAKIISKLRADKAKKIYSQIGGKSPILEETVAQQQAIELKLKQILGNEFKVFICMRHWHPMGYKVAQDVKEYNPTEVILLPLYPQFSTTTTGSAINNFLIDIRKNYKNKNLPVIKSICCYPIDEGFIKSHIELIEQALKSKQNKNNFRILFSAHSLPNKIIAAGDPYQWQIERSVASIVQGLNIPDLDYKITYQSRVGPLQWLKPSTEEEIIRSAAENKEIIIVPISFVSEHSETLVELDIDYRKLAEKHAARYIRVPALRINANFIETIAKIIVEFSSSSEGKFCSSNMRRLCPENFTLCPCNAIN